MVGRLDVLKTQFGCLVVGSVFYYPRLSQTSPFIKTSSHAAASVYPIEVGSMKLNRSVAIIVRNGEEVYLYPE
jgi:hypothetical protein